MFSERYQRIRHLLHLLQPRTQVAAVWRVWMIRASLLIGFCLSVATLYRAITYIDTMCPPTCLIAETQANTTNHTQPPPSTAQMGIFVTATSTRASSIATSTLPIPQATSTSLVPVTAIAPPTSTAALATSTSASSTATPTLPIPQATSTSLVPMAATATVLVLPTQPTSICATTDYQAPLTGVHPPIAQRICVPPGQFTWISSDPVTLNIPDINYTATFTERSSMFFIGPVIFQLTEVDAKNVWMETRTDTTLFGNTDRASINIIYHQGSVCPITAFTGTSCP